MRLSCEVKGLGHRYQHNFLFRQLSFDAQAEAILMLKGHNGSGKSTLLKILTGAMEPIEGTVLYKKDDETIDAEKLWKMVGLVAPYQELPEELSLKELIDFQVAMVPEAGNQAQYLKMVERFGMEKALDQTIQLYSTGMKQKARIILSLTEGRPVWLLDEPTSNLDPESHLAFWEMIQKAKGEKLVIVASNDPTELAFADRVLELSPSLTLPEGKRTNAGKN